MFQPFLQEFSGRSMGVLVGMLLGTSITAWVAYRKRRQDRARVLHGDARDTVVIHQHIIDEETGPHGEPRRIMRIRTLGQAELRRVIPNAYLAAILAQRAFAVTPTSTLISMDGAEGSYLLETMTNFVCDRLASRQFPHEMYLMAACCEPASLSHHQPITILLLRQKDLPLFADWSKARELLVEHGSDGARILTLCEVARKFQEEQRRIDAVRAAGQSATFLETMYVLDLAIDQNSAPLPSKPVPWERYRELLRSILPLQVPRSTDLAAQPNSAGQ
jgi:hypothetical protein